MDGWAFLDLFSTSQTLPLKTDEINLTCASDFCINFAPYFAYQKQQNTYGVVQGCCNSWLCPRCGQMRARQEYGRIVEGCRKLSEKHELWFITITCRGKEMSVKEADVNYGKWTNTLLTRWRTYAARHGQKWYYVQVTERQKRGHPHSHILTSFQPPDITLGKKSNWTINNMGMRIHEEKEVLRSNYVRRSSVDVGLGDQYDISRVSSVEGASRYVAKYLFKDTVFSTLWPEGWKRVRYSQSFPKLDKTSSNAFVLITREDWQKLGRLASIISTDCDQTKGVVYSALGWMKIKIK